MTSWQKDTEGPAPPPSRRMLLGELLVLAALAAAFLVAFESRPGYVDVLLASAAVGVIALGRSRTLSLWAQQAAAADGAAGRLRNAFAAAGLFTAIALLVLAVIGGGLAYHEGGFDAAWRRLANPRLVVAGVLYLPWAVLQQFVFQFYLLPRLLVFLPAAAAVGLTAAAFASVHYPRTPVMAVTLIAGIVWALLYRRYRALLPLAISHALLGASLHYWVFGRDLVGRWLGLA